MNKRISYIIICLLFLILVCGCSKNKVESEVINTMKIKIDNDYYVVELENNQVVDELIELLPINLTMNELNGNEKYAYLNTSFSTNPINVKHINAGDIMLYGNNCLVIFYKSFDTNYSYTKIGHINDMPSLNGDDINVVINKE